MASTEEPYDTASKKTPNFSMPRRAVSLCQLTGHRDQQEHAQNTMATDKPIPPLPSTDPVVVTNKPTPPLPRSLLSLWTEHVNLLLQITGYPKYQLDEQYNVALLVIVNLALVVGLVSISIQVHESRLHGKPDLSVMTASLVLQVLAVSFCLPYSVIMSWKIRRKRQRARQIQGCQLRCQIRMHEAAWRERDGYGHHDSNECDDAFDFWERLETDPNWLLRYVERLRELLHASYGPREWGQIEEAGEIALFLLQQSNEDLEQLLLTNRRFAKGG